MQKPTEANTLFSKLATLSTTELPADKLIRVFDEENKKYPESFLQKIIARNRETFKFVGIVPEIRQHGHSFSLALTTSKFIGAVPFFSPKSGVPICDINIVGRYNEEIGELLPILMDSLKPDYSDNLRLTQSSIQKPPIYIECCRYIDKYIEAERYKWQKFANIERIQSFPNGGTRWDKYASDVACDPNTFNRFHNKSNILSTEHKSWWQLNYILGLSLDIIESKQTPIRVRLAYAEKASTLRKLLSKSHLEPTQQLKVSMADPVVIKDLKAIGKLILDGDTNIRNAWRLDYADFFEKYVQYLIREVVKKKGGTSFNNCRYPIYGKKHPRWGLSYLEPDIIAKKNQTQYVIDAKYKSHIFNWADYSDELKDDFRHDLHQVIAYSSFSKSEERNVMLVYPFTAFCSHDMTISSPYDSTTVKVKMVGVPVSKNLLEETKENLASIIQFP